MASAYMFSHYWPGDGQVNEPPVTTVVDTYPMWKIGSTSFFALLLLMADPGAVAVAGALGVTIPRVWQKRLTGWWIRGYRDWVPERLYVLVRVLRFLVSEDYQRARAAVRVVAVSGLSNKKLWGLIGQRAAQDPHLAENLYRHLYAVDVIGPLPAGRQARNLLLELAWLALKERHR